MNKYLFPTLAAALIAASCSSVEENEVFSSDSNQISFGSYINQPVKSLEKSVFAEGDQLCVNACQSQGSVLTGTFTNNFMQNELLTKTGTGWTYDNPRFWPMNAIDRVSFVANYPASVTPHIADGICSFDFQVNDDPSLQQEFLWSTIGDAHRSDRNGTHQNGILEQPATSPITDVVLHFRHALSKVRFSAKAATNYGAATITVTDIEVKNLYNAGTYSLTSSLGKGTWALSGAQNHQYKVLTGGGDFAIHTYYKDFGSSLLTVPQQLSTEDGKASTVTIRYTVSYKNPGKVVEEERTFNLATPSIKAWEQDKVYNYQFNIALDMITFDATIDSWSNTEYPEFGVE